MSGSIGFSPISLYEQYAAHETTDAAAAMKADPQASTLIAYFNKNAADITTPAQLLKNYKVLSVVLGAFNLQSSINDTALLKQLMTQNPAAKNSLSQQLANPQYTLFAQAMSDWTTSPFATAATRAQLVQAFTTNTFEQNVNSQAAGLGNALYFTREASSITTLTQLQADPNLLQVAVATTGVPYDDFGALEFNQQTALLQKNIKVSQLTTPSYVKQIAEQYLVQQTSNSQSTPAPGTLAALYSDGTDTSGDSVLSILDPQSVSTDTNDSSSGSVLSLFA